MTRVLTAVGIGADRLVVLLEQTVALQNQLLGDVDYRTIARQARAIANEAAAGVPEHPVARRDLELLAQAARAVAAGADAWRAKDTEGAGKAALALVAAAARMNERARGVM